MRVVVADRAVQLALDRQPRRCARDLRARGARRRSPISLPSVVGVAVWPCVRASIGTSACACASARRSAATDVEQPAAASSRRASSSAMPYARLLMSSDVHAKWMNSGDARDLRRRREALLQPVLDRLDVVVGRALDRLDARGVGDGERRRRPRRASRAPRPRTAALRRSRAPRQARRARRSRRARAARIRPNSLKCSAQRVDLRRVAAVERRQRGEGRGVLAASSMAIVYASNRARAREL